MNLPNYDVRLVAFIDILGFEALVKSFRREAELHLRVHQALMRIKAIDLLSHNHGTVPYNLEVTVFSDSIVFSCSKDRFDSLIYTCGYLQADLFFLGILVRGGISIGNTFHSGGILYGEGMLNAYRIESKAAVYPRIVIDPEISFGISKIYMERFIERDDDGLLSINAFKFESVIPDAAELAAEGYCPRAEYLRNIKEHLENGFRSAQAVDQRAKWSWLIRKYNSEVEIYNRTNHCNIDYVTTKTEASQSNPRILINPKDQ
ncbi:MAG: hypothetical protein NTW21_41150 [Verrucomicrobia bacterium]|nr:hypothetical protein [Verrucomicrobiota bacterium]